MNTFDPDAPWQVNVLLLAGFGLANVVVMAVTAWFTIRPTSRRVRTIEKSAKVTEYQTANEHETNLREDIDVVVASLEHLTEQVKLNRADAGLLHGEMRDARRDIVGIRTDARRDRREIAKLRQEFQQHISPPGEDEDEIESPASRGALVVKRGMSDAKN